MIHADEAVSLDRPAGEEDHVLGPAEAAVTLLEYGDYQCPYCRRAHGAVSEVLEVMHGRVRYMWRHFPLRDKHPHALAAAQAAEAAAAQGKFWQMHDALFAHQRALERKYLLIYAEEIGIDVTRFAAELDRGVYLPRVERDLQSGLQRAVDSTPTFFINDKLFEGTWDAPHLMKALDRAARLAKRT